MDTSTIEALGRASSLELFHLSSVVDRLMSDPKRILEIRRQLHLGQTVRYVDCRAIGAGLTLRSGRIVAMKDTTLIVKDDELRCEWKLPYAAIEVPSTDDPAMPAHEARNEPPHPSRDDFRVGDRVGFDDRHLQTHIGTIVRINQRTASIDCDGHNWRVSFDLLRHIIDL